MIRKEEGAGCLFPRTLSVYLLYHDKTRYAIRIFTNSDPSPNRVCTVFHSVQQTFQTLFIYVKLPVYHGDTPAVCSLSYYRRSFTRDRAASSATRVKSGCSCRMEPGAWGLMGPKKQSFTA